MHFVGLLVAAIGLMGGSLARAASFDECFEYSKLLNENRQVVPTISENGLRADWVIQGKTLGCRVNESGRMLSLVTAATEMKRESLVKMFGPNAGQIEYSDEEDKAFVAAGVEYLTGMLKDSSSVQWRNVFISSKKFPMLCGEINARNSYGAYTGFKRFYYSRTPELTSIQAGPSDEVFLGMFSSMCKEARKPVEIAASEKVTNNSVADEISKLADLYKKGVLTDTEFSEQKKKLLNK